MKPRPRSGMALVRNLTLIQHWERKRYYFRYHYNLQKINFKKKYKLCISCCTLTIYFICVIVNVNLLGT